MTRVLSSFVLAAVLAAAVVGCAKSSSSSGPSAQATMVYSGSTDTSTGSSATAVPAPMGSSASVAAGDALHGKQIFSQNCSACHGASGTEGGVGPSLKAEKTRKTFSATIAWIKNPSPPMPKLYPSPLDDKDVADVAAYVQSL